MQRVLVDGAQIEHADADGNTSLLLSVDKGGSVDLVRVLLQNGANVNVENHSGRAPLAAAVDKDRAVLVKLLLAHGASADKLSSEALSNCSEEIRRMIEEHRCASVALREARAAPDVDACVAAALAAAQVEYVTLVLPCLLSIHSTPPAGLPPKSERALASVVLLVLEHLPGSDTGEPAAQMRKQIDSVRVAGPLLAVVEDMVISHTPYDVLLSLRLLQALLRADGMHGALVERYYLMPIIQALAQERGAHYETLALQPPIALAFAEQPAAAMLSKVVPLQ